MDSLDRFAQATLDGLDAQGLLRGCVETERGASPMVERGGRRLVSFSCNDYLNLSAHPAVIASAATALRHGFGAGASRLVTGEHPVYAGLEQRLAALKGTEAAVVFGSGYLANLGILPALAEPGDLILADKLAHACILAGAGLSGARVLRFAHNDAEHCAKLLETHRAAHRHCLIVTEGVFSMDGDLAPLPELARLAGAFDAWLMTDDAHALGVVGGGRGSAFAFGDKIDIPLQMGTLSKAVGGYGGYLCASKAVTDLMRNKARSFIYTTALPPSVVAGCEKALAIIAEDEALVAAPLAKARRFAEQMGLPEPQSSILPIILGASERAVEASQALAERGFLVAAIRPPTVPPNTARLRLTFSAAHRDADIDGLAGALRALGLGTAR